MQIRKPYTVTAIGGTSVTLTPQTGFENVSEGGNPGLLGTGTVVITQGVTPDASFWKSTGKYIVEVERVF